MDNKRYMTLWQKIAYAIGNPGANFCNATVGSFVLIYLTDTIGMNSAIIGTIMLISKLIDGVTDVVFGLILDRTKSRFGKARPWLLRMSLPLVISTFLLFSMPTTVSTASYIYFFIIYTLMTAVFHTAVFTAYNALIVRITKSENERMSGSVIGGILYMILGIVSSFATVEMVSAFGGGAVGWRIVALIYCVFVAICLGICAFSCKELPEEVLNENIVVQDKPSIKESIKGIAGNKNFWLMIFAVLFFTIASSSNNSIATYYCKYVIESDSFFGVIAISTMIPMMISLAITPKLASKIGSHKIVASEFVISAISAVLVLVFAMNNAVVPMIIFMAIRGFCMGPFTGIQPAINGVIVDCTKIKTGQDITGMIFSFNCLFSKLGQALTTGSIGWLLAAVRYDGLAAAQSPEVLRMITLIFAGFPLVGLAVCAVLLMFLNPWREMENIQASERTDAATN